MPNVFLGMPVFNGEIFIRESLDSLLSQTYENWMLLIADNASTDETEAICQEYSAKDKRISYIRHESNKGALFNFKYVLDQADLKYFMWAAADDEWSKDYLECCINTLDSCSNVQFVGGNIVNIDPAGLVLRNYSGFSRFDSENQLKRLTNYLLAPEINGKANLIYSMYRTDFCRVLWAIPDILCGWGSDMTFVFAALNRGSYKYIPSILLLKRVISENDIKTCILIGNKQYEQIEYYGWFPTPYFKEYRDAYYKIATDNQVKVLIWLVMAFRYVVLRCRLRLQDILSILKRCRQC